VTTKQAMSWNVTVSKHPLRVVDEIKAGVKLQALDFLRPQETLVVWRLDRLGRSLKDLGEKVERLRGRGIGFGSLHEKIDTTSSAGKFEFHVAFYKLAHASSSRKWT
jgi:hypothetical protein